MPDREKRSSAWENVERFAGVRMKGELEIKEWQELRHPKLLSHKRRKRGSRRFMEGEACKELEVKD